jgi:hypothetical protein
MVPATRGPEGSPKCEDPHTLTETGTGVCRCEFGLAESLDDGGVGHAAALTHGLQAITTAALFESAEQRRHDACTAGAQRMSDRDRTIDVALAEIGASVFGPG